MPRKLQPKRKSDQKAFTEHNPLLGCSECPLHPDRVPLRRFSDLPRYLIVSKPPSESMVMEGIPMSKSAVSYLLQQATAAGFSKKDFAVASCVQCHFDQDRTDTKTKRKIKTACAKRLQRTIEKVKPEVVIPLGADAASAVMGRAVKITKARGVLTTHPTKNYRVYPMLDVDFVRMYTQHQKTFETDFTTLQKIRQYGYDLDRLEQDTTVPYKFVTSLDEVIAEYQEGMQLSFDLETRGLRYADPKADIVCMQFSWGEHMTYFLPWTHSEYVLPRRSKAKVKKQLRYLFEELDVGCIGQNLKFDMVWVYYKLGIQGRIEDDTLLICALLDENDTEKNLDSLTRRYVPELAGYADSFNQEFDKSRMDLVPLDRLIPYACGDVVAARIVLNVLKPRLLKDKKLTRVYDYITLPAVNTFIRIEARGRLIDHEALDAFEIVMAEDVECQRKDLMKDVPRSIKRKHIEKGLKFSRPDFVRDILFNHPDGFCFTPKVFTDSTARLDPSMRVPSTSAKDHLPFFFDESDWVIKFAKYVQDERLLSTSIRKFRENYVIGDRIHPTYSFTTAVTGRTASKAPNCFPGYVEVLTDKGWMRFDEVTGGETVAQYSMDTRTISFAKPVEFIQHQFTGPLYHISTEQQISCVSTGNHRFVVKDRRTGDTRFKVAEQYPKDMKQVQAGTYVGGDLSYRHTQVILLAALQADGHVNEYGGIDFALSRKRKVDRLLYALSSEGIRHSQKTSFKDGKRRYRIYIPGTKVPSWLSGRKRFGSWILSMDAASFGSLAKEIWFWDGDFTRQATWVSARKSDADWVQVLLTLAGSRAWMREASNRTCDSFYVVNSASRDSSSTANHVVEYEQFCGTVYCFTMPEDTLIVRHNGRVSITGNSQNFPNKGATGKAYGKVFPAPEGHIIIMPDYSQMELRIAAHMARDPVMIRLYKEGKDLHAATAMEAMGLTQEAWDCLDPEKRGTYRQYGKPINFGYLYGMWWRKFKSYAKTKYGLEFTDSEAEQARNAYFTLYGNLEPWHKNTRRFVHKHKYVRSPLGRVRHLPMIDSPDEGVVKEAERQGINSPVQATGSDLGLLAMNMIDVDIDEMYIALCGFVHDCIYAYTPVEYAIWALRTTIEYMENLPLKELFGFEFGVPIVADPALGYTVGDKVELKKYMLEPDYDHSSIPGIDPPLPPQKIPPNDGLLD